MVPPTEAQLKSWITRAVADSAAIKPSMTSSLKEAVKEAVREELASINVGKVTATAEERQFVKNLATGVVHLAAKQGSGLAGWTAKCGWRLAPASKAAILSVGTLPPLHKFVCEKCLPLERSSQKLALSGAAGSQCGGP